MLIAVPADAAGALDVHQIAATLDVSLARLIVLIAPSNEELDRHTTRLRFAARQQDWELVPADGLHQRIIDTLTTSPTEEGQI